MDQTERRVVSAAAVRRTVVAAVAGGLVTVLVAGLPSVRLVYRSPEGHLVLETAVAMVGGLVALLVYGRFRRRHALQDLLLVHSLSVLAVAALFFIAIPLVLGATQTSAITTWAPLLVRLVGSVLLLCAALTSRRHVITGAQPRREALVAAALLVCLAVLVQLLATSLPTAVTALPPPETSAQPLVEGHPLVIAAQLANLLCFAAASVLFTRQAARTGDELVGWVGAACAVGAWARVNYLLFPSLYSEWLYTGDFLRLGFYLLLLVGAVREIHAYWAAQSEAAVFAERRRLARDLHDGTVQELGYIRRTARAQSLNSPAAAQIEAAADRAMDEARRAIAALTAPVDEPAGTALRRAVSEVGARYDVPVHVLDEGDAQLPAEHREALVRIAREAVSNAARHGKPSAVTFILRAQQLVIEDDGIGFLAATVPPGHFGLISMRDRAEGIGAELSVESSPGAGTKVAVRW
jgi:signal transduction histidine kinase